MASGHVVTVNVKRPVDLAGPIMTPSPVVMAVKITPINPGYALLRVLQVGPYFGLGYRGCDTGGVTTPIIPFVVIIRTIPIIGPRWWRAPGGRAAGGGPTAAGRPGGRAAGRWIGRGRPGAGGSGRERAGRWSGRGRVAGRPGGRAAGRPGRWIGPTAAGRPGGRAAGGPKILCENRPILFDLPRWRGSS